MEQTDSRKINLCIATRNKFESTIRSFMQVINDDRIDQIIIVDDFSDDVFWWKLEDWLQFEAPNKIKLCRNEMSLGAELNRQRAVIFADSEYMILLDEDKVVTPKDIDFIYSQEWEENNIAIFPFGEFANQKDWLRNFDHINKFF